MTNSKVPAISIGMPVYNGGQELRRAFDTLLAQTFTDFELIVSDNASSDGTGEVCQQYASLDDRIRYVRQAGNIGATQNFKFVLEQARGNLFMWAAADDFRSPDFLEVNHAFLAQNHDYVASTSPNGFANKEVSSRNLTDFAIEGTRYERFRAFFRNCWQSHGVFYSLMRREAIQDCEFVGADFFAADWVIDLHLAWKGSIGRTRTGYTVFGVRGISNGKDAYGAFRKKHIEYLLPFYELSRYVLGKTRGFSPFQRALLIAVLVRLNARANWHRGLSAFRARYRRLLGTGTPEQNAPFP